MASPSTPDLLLDRVVAAIGDRYEVEGELGRGGMAVVYRARDVRLRRPVALKVLPPDLAYREGVRARFLREAETAAQLNHPHIVPIYAADETAGVAWLAMALVDGETLGARMARAPRMPVAEARRVLAEVADALAYAHARGVVHRDIKPDNILLDRESGRALVTDFGIARAAEADARLTVTGIAVGTPTYMSPEQALGEREVDGRSDLYSLGVVGFQMLTGAPPFQATSAAALLMKHVGEHPAPIAQLRADAPPALAYAIDQALAKKPEQRHAGAAEFRRAILDAAGAAGPPPTPAASSRSARRRPEPFSPAVLAEAAPPPPASPRPAAPAMPTMPIDWRDQRQEWREHRELLREQRKAWKERQRMQQAMRELAPSNLPAPLAMAGAPVSTPWAGGGPFAMAEALTPLEHRAEAFRRRTFGLLTLLVFLTFINFVTMAASGAPFPWVIFPAFGIISGIRRRWRPLAREGLSFSDVMVGGADRATAARAQAAGRVERRVRKLQRRVNVVIVGAVGAVISFVIGSTLDADPMVVPFVGFLALAGWGLLSGLLTAFRVKRAGVRVRDALSSTRWRDAIHAADTRPRETIVAEEAARLVGPEVLAGSFGRVVRGAVDDRMMVRETLAKLSPADRALLPEVMPTIDALAQRVAELAQSLHRLEGDVAPTQLDAIDARLRLIDAEPAGAPDRERKRQLLQRQRASVVELTEKRALLAAQMESAQLVLQNLKLDLIKLRSKGVGAAIGEVSSATQEARVLSRDIANALQAAAEVRGL